MTRNKKSKAAARRRSEPKGQHRQQDQSNGTTNTPQTPVNQKKRTAEDEAGQWISKYLKSKTETPTQRAAGTKPSPTQANLNSLDPLGMELATGNAAEKADAEPAAIGELEQDDSTPSKKPEVAGKGDGTTGLVSEMEDMEAAVRKLQKQMRSFKKKLSRGNTCENK